MSTTVAPPEGQDTEQRAALSANEEPGTWLAELEAHIWAMRPESLASLARLAANGQLHATVNDEKVEAARRRGRPPAIEGGVVTVPLKGVLMPMGGLLAMLFDIEDPIQGFRRAMREALGNDDVGAIVVDVDSPGGVVDNIPEVAAELRKARGTKPIVAVTNTLAASAAYWLASQADEVIITPSGMAGSIGVYQVHRDMSGAMELMGVKTTFISAGKYKTEGNGFEPLSEEAREHFQEDVDYYYDLFVKDVAAGRKAKVADVRRGYGEGRVLTAKRAVEEGLADRVETYDEAVARLSSRSRGSISRALGASEHGAPEAADDDTDIEAEANAGVVGDAEQPEAEADAGADQEHDALDDRDDSGRRLSQADKYRIFDSIELFAKNTTQEDN